MEEPRNVGSVGTVLASMHEVGPWHSISLEWLCRPVTPALRRWRQEEQEWEASLCYLLSPAWTARDGYF